MTTALLVPVISIIVAICRDDDLGGPPPCDSGITGIQDDPNILTNILYGHYDWVGGPPNLNQCKVQVWVVWGGIFTQKKVGSERSAWDALYANLKLTHLNPKLSTLEAKRAHKL